VTLLATNVNSKRPLVRRISLRDELPDVCYRLTTSPPGAEVPLALDERHFSLFLAGHQLEAQSASVAIETPFEDLARASVGLARPTGRYLRRRRSTSSATAPQLPTGGVDGGLRELDCGSVLRTPPATRALRQRSSGRT
jgi:hypothetical protein